MASTHSASRMILYPFCLLALASDALINYTATMRAQATARSCLYKYELKSTSKKTPSTGCQDISFSISNGHFFHVSHFLDAIHIQMEQRLREKVQRTQAIVRSAVLLGSFMSCAHNEHTARCTPRRRVGKLSNPLKSLPLALSNERYKCSCVYITTQANLCREFTHTHTPCT